MVFWELDTIRLDGICGKPQYPRGNGGRLLNTTEIRKAKPKGAAYQLTDGLGLFLWLSEAWQIATTRYKDETEGRGRQFSAAVLTPRS